MPSFGVTSWGKPSRVVLLGIRLTDQLPWEREAAFDPIEAWIARLGYEVTHRVWQRREAPDPATFLGRGKLQQLADLCRRDGVTGAVLDGRLRPGQRRGIERILGVGVWDRSIWDANPTGAVSRLAPARVRDGRFQVILWGAAGAGKSTLFSALTGGPILPPSWPVAPCGVGPSLRRRGLRGEKRFSNVVVVDTPGLIPMPDGRNWTVPEMTKAALVDGDIAVHVVDSGRADAPELTSVVGPTARALGLLRTLTVWTQDDRRVAGQGAWRDGWIVSGRSGKGCARLAEFLRGVAAGGVAPPRGVPQRPLVGDSGLCYSGRRW